MADDYEPAYFAAVAKVQSMFAGAPTPGEVVRAIERLGWAPRAFVEAELSKSLAPSMGKADAFDQIVKEFRASIDAQDGIVNDPDDIFRLIETLAAEHEPSSDGAE